MEVSQLLDPHYPKAYWVPSRGCIHLTPACDVVQGHTDNKEGLPTISGFSWAQ